ncbi:MAG TPA: hypothetical protein VF826_13130 [Chloroflexia bacterium]|jgi:hypothetical protein
MASLGIGLVLAGLTVGLSLGLFQTRVLRMCLAGTDATTQDQQWLARWPQISTVALTFCWVLAGVIGNVLVSNDVASSRDPILPVIVYFPGMLVLGILQWLVLRPYSRYAALWVITTPLGWCIGIFLGLRAGDIAFEMAFPTRSLGGGILIGFGELLFAFVSGTVAAVLSGVITTPSLILLLQKSTYPTASAFTAP